MNPQRLRLALALFNLVILLGIAWTCAGLFLPRKVPRELTAPEDFDPLAYAVATEGVQRSSVESYRDSWLQLDRPKPVAAPTAEASGGPVVRNPQDLSTRYQLLMASVDPSHPENSSFVVQSAGGQQQTLGIGDSLDGYQVLQVVIQGEDDNREAIVTVDDRGTPSTIKLSRVGGIQ